MINLQMVCILIPSTIKISFTNIDTTRLYIKSLS
jgi:hypothetical protein